MSPSSSIPISEEGNARCDQVKIPDLARAGLGEAWRSLVRQPILPGGLSNEGWKKQSIAHSLSHNRFLGR